jgi:formate hydrogenlyase subunit 3/multisubunit Na+/H+ antiporter MnhD subunit
MMTITVTAITLLIFATLLALVSERASSYNYKVVFKIAGYSLLLILILILYNNSVIDTVSIILAGFFTVISLLISLYTPLYARSLHYPSTLEALVDLFLYSLIVAYIAPNIIVLVSAWTIVEILSFILIRVGEEHSLEGPLTSSRGFLLTSTTTYELSVFTFIATSFFALGISPHVLLEPFQAVTSKFHTPYMVLPLILVGFLTKAAITPLHFWLPSAHSTAPSPASAALSGFTVALGYYGLYRVLNYISTEDIVWGLAITLIVLGLLSILYGGVEALTQRDVKRLLAYGTIMTNGFILALFALYLFTRLKEALVLVLTGVLTQATYKTTLFCEAGLFEALYETRYAHLIRGVVRVLPISSAGGILAVLSLIGVPGTLGFILKIGALYVALSTPTITPTLLALLITSLAFYIALSAIIGLKYIALYYSQPRRQIPVVRSISKQHQLTVLILGLTNISITPILFQLLGYSQLALITLVLSPLPLIVTYLVVHAARVQPRDLQVSST